jgi:hypothetical protein
LVVLPLPPPQTPPPTYNVTLRDNTNTRVWLRPTAEEHATKYQPGYGREIVFTTDNIKTNGFLYVTSKDNPKNNGWVRATYVVYLPENSLPGAGAATYSSSASSSSDYVDQSDKFWRLAAADPKFAGLNISNIMKDYNSVLTPSQRQNKEEFDHFISGIGKLNPKYKKMNAGSRSRKYKNKISKKRSRSVHKRRRNNRSKTSRNVRHRVR